jgi:thiopurine S-methyltransferase
MAHFSKLEPTTVLVPLCGKSLDLLWLASRGHHVIGVELSEVGVRSFFSESGILPSESPGEGFKVFDSTWQSGRITIYQGDFFAMSAGLLGSIGAVYDRAALIALPAEMRRSYTTHLRSLVAQCGRPSFKQLQIVLERTPNDTQGPPFSVSGGEVAELYPGYSCRLLSRETLSDEGGIRREECVYLLEPLQSGAGSGQ